MVIATKIMPGENLNDEIFYQQKFPIYGICEYMYVCNHLHVYTYEKHTFNESCSLAFADWDLHLSPTAPVSLPYVTHHRQDGGQSLQLLHKQRCSTQIKHTTTGILHPRFFLTCSSYKPCWAQPSHGVHMLCHNTLT